jgi:hypothetical protein
VDSKTLIDNINKLPNLNTLKNSKVNRYKQYFLADSGYDTEENKNFLKEKGYIPLIKYNKRNTKDKNKIKKNLFTKKHKQIYKRRLKIEPFFAWLKNKPVINQNYQKTIESYFGLVTIANLIILRIKMNTYLNYFFWIHLIFLIYINNIINIKDIYLSVNIIS